MSLSISFRDRRGQTYNKTFDHVRDAYERLATLHSIECNCEKYAPTDSGDTRFIDTMEREALMLALPMDLASLAYRRGYGLQ